MKKIKTKIIFALMLSASFYLFVGINIANAGICVCAIENKTPAYRIATSTAQECNIACASQSYRYYSWNDGKSGNDSTGVNNQPVTASPTGVVPNATATKYSSTFEPMEEIPGFGRPRDFPSYLMAVYKFGLWAIGICALLMITIGGYMYIASAGNKSSVETAKKIIFDALAGVILAMASWLLLYLINPDLIKFM